MKLNDLSACRRKTSIIGWHQLLAISTSIIGRAYSEQKQTMNGRVYGLAHVAASRER